MTPTGWRIDHDASPPLRADGAGIARVGALDALHRLARNQVEKPAGDDLLTVFEPLPDFDLLSETQAAGDINTLRPALAIHDVHVLARLIPAQRGERNHPAARRPGAEFHPAELPRRGSRGNRGDFHLDGAAAGHRVERRIDAGDAAFVHPVAQGVDAHPGDIADGQVGQDEFGDRQFRHQRRGVGDGEQVLVALRHVTRLREPLAHHPVQGTLDGGVAHAGFEHLFVGLGDLELGLGAGVFILGDELLATQFLQAVEVLFGLLARGGGPGKLRLDERIVQPYHDVARLHPVTFVDRQRGDAPFFLGIDFYLAQGAQGTRAGAHHAEAVADHRRGLDQMHRFALRPTGSGSDRNPTGTPARPRGAVSRQVAKAWRQRDDHNERDGIEYMKDALIIPVTARPPGMGKISTNVCPAWTTSEGLLHSTSGRPAF